jgi:hypothetical protein
VYTEDIEAFVARAGAPSPALVERAMSALAVATAPTSELAQLWQDDSADWTEAISKLRTALEG